MERFDNLGAALFDTSSIIYLEKCGCIHILSCFIRMYSTAPVVEELGRCPVKLNIVKGDSMNADQSVIQGAIRHKLALVSEDRKILRSAEKGKIEYYNTLMMLEYLYYSRALSEDLYSTSLDKLMQTARYSPGVWTFGQKLHHDIYMSYNFS